MSLSVVVNRVEVGAVERFPLPPVALYSRVVALVTVGALVEPHGRADVTQRVDEVVLWPSRS